VAVRKPAAVSRRCWSSGSRTRAWIPDMTTSPSAARYLSSSDMSIMGCHDTRSGEASDFKFGRPVAIWQHLKLPKRSWIASRAVDDIDRSILYELQVDGRLSNLELADRVGLSPSPCLQRVKRLVEHGVIQRFTAVVDAERVERGLSVTVFADLTSNAPASVERFEALVLAMEGVVDFRRMFGRPDYIITIETRDLASYEELYQTDLARLREIGRLESHIPMRVLRDHTSPPAAAHID
jgi:DNA-binding Lrp family transcriptional regulator